MKILITGSNGLLGQKIVSQLLNRKIGFIATSKGENRNPDCPQHFYRSLDITLVDEVNVCFEEEKPTHIIHTAAITNVDHCEEDPNLCQLVNVTATNYLFEASKRAGLHFQLLSTDFVFDGEKGNYKEEDTVNPLSVYAKSKVEGEKLLLESEYENWSIVRTIIVYGTGHNLSRSNLFLWAKAALPKKEVMKVVDDQYRAPTWANDLAWACIAICEKDKRGIFHICGPKTYSIYELVKVVADHYNWSMDKVEKISSSTLNQAAKRPPRTGFNLHKAKTELGYQPKTIEETLDKL